MRPSKLALAALSLRLLASTALAQQPAPPAAPTPAVQQQVTPTPTARSTGQQAPVFQQGEGVASVGVALGGMNGAAGSTVVPPIIGGFDYGLTPDISVGAVASYYKSSMDVGYGLGSWTYSYLAVGARSDYHFGRFVPVERLDLYGGLLLGYGVLSVSAPASTSPFGGATGSSANIFIWGVNLGGRYFFTPSLAAQVELGVGLGNLSAGLAYKF
jgi:hypothetical protein